MKQTKAPLDYASRPEDSEFLRRERQKNTVLELAAWVGILVAVAAITAILAYTAYVADSDIKAYQERAKGVEAIQVVPSWELKETQQ